MLQLMTLLAQTVGNVLRIRVVFKLDVAASLKAVADIVRAFKGR